jgi:hypothetical protein
VRPARHRGPERRGRRLPLPPSSPSVVTMPGANPRHPIGHQFRPRFR